VAQWLAQRRHRRDEGYHSLAIHTAAELKKTDTICADYLKAP
jgi:hypothetical protein